MEAFGEKRPRYVIGKVAACLLVFSCYASSRNLAIDRYNVLQDRQSQNNVQLRQDLHWEDMHTDGRNTALVFLVGDLAIMYGDMLFFEERRKHNDVHIEGVAER